MRRLFNRSVLSAVLVLGPVATAGQSLLAQERDYPMLNSIGRYLGIGYTQGGYHAAADGRFDWVTTRHDPQGYSSQRLMYPYNPYYQSSRQALQPQVDSMGLTDGIQPGVHQAVPAQPAAPVGPAPQWLKPYLKDGIEPPAEPVARPPATREIAPLKFDDAEPSDVQPSASDDLLLESRRMHQRRPAVEFQRSTNYSAAAGVPTPSPNRYIQPAPRY